MPTAKATTACVGDWHDTHRLHVETAGRGRIVELHGHQAHEHSRTGTGPFSIRPRNCHFTPILKACLFAFISVSCCAVLTFPSFASASPILLSGGKPCLASSVESSSFPCSYAFDGNASTRWSSAFVDPQWIQVDLGQTSVISQVNLQWETAYATAYQIQVSADGDTWSTVYSTTTGTGGTNTLSVNGIGRYVRMYATARKYSYYGDSLWEFQVYGTPQNEVGVATGKPCSASSLQSSSFPCGYANDGNTSTRWSSASSDPQWWQVDLGSTMSINRVDTNWEAAYASHYQIQTSTNGTDYTTVADVYPTAAGLTSTTFHTISARYVRIYGLTRATFWGYSIWETQVYALSTVTPAPTVFLNASQQYVSPGNNTALTWSSTNVTSCTASGGWSGNQATSGTQDTGPINTSQTYQLSCTGSAGTATASVTVDVIPNHIDTWAYDACGSTAPSSLVQKWVTYAESTCGPTDTKALNDCQVSGTTYCTAVAYLDANHIYSQGSVPIEAAAAEDWWLHEPGYSDSAHRITFPGVYGTGYLLNQSNPAVDSWIDNYVTSNFDSYGALMMDDSSGGLSNELYPSGYATSAELSTDAALQASHEQMASSIKHVNGTPFIQIDNGNGDNPNLTSALPLLNNPSNVVGVISEGAPWDGGVIPSSFYDYVLDNMAYIDHTTNDFQVLLSYDPSGSQQGRRVQEATLLLGFSPGHTVGWSDLDTNSNDLSVWPEEGIYSTNPIQSMGEPGGSNCFMANGLDCSTGGHNDVEVSPNVYVREFRNCYNQGAAFGNCAVIMNNTSSPVTVQSSWLHGSYAHQITFNGGDVQSNGSLNLTGAAFTPGSTTVPANDAMMLAP